MTAPLPWIQYLERSSPDTDPHFTDVANRPLKALLRATGHGTLQPDVPDTAPFTGIRGPVHNIVTWGPSSGLMVGEGNSAIDSAAFDAAAAASALGGGPVYIPAGTYTINGSTSVGALEMERGAVLSIDSGQTLTINGPFNPPFVTCFAGSGTVKFGSGAVSTSYAEWFDGADWGARCSKAIQALSLCGGTAAVCTAGACTTGVNMTGLTKGVTFESRGASADGVTSNLMLTHTHTGPACIDLTGSHGCAVRNICFATNATTHPRFGVLQARILPALPALPSTAGGAGENTFFNVRFDYATKLEACFYNYGSEVNKYSFCYAINNPANGHGFFITGFNVLGATSAFQTITTGGQSTRCNYFNDCTSLCFGGSASGAKTSNWWLEACADTHIRGGFTYNAASGSDGFANVYIDGTNSACDVFSYTGVSGEVASPTYIPKHGVYYTTATVGQTCNTWIITGANRFNCRTRTVMVAGVGTIHGLVYEGNVDQIGEGVEVYKAESSRISTKTAKFTVTSGGALTECHIVARRANVTLNSVVPSGGSIIDPQLSGFPGTRKATATWDPPSLATGSQQTTTVTVTGCALGDLVQVSFSLDLQATEMRGYVSSANTVTVVHRNVTGGTINLGSGTLRVACIAAEIT